MDIREPLPLLGGMTAERFMRQYWQRKPLLVRGAVADLEGAPDRALLLALAGQDGVESRLVRQSTRGWTLRQGPLPRRALPPLSQAQWTLLVQGVDLHDDAAHALLQRFRFVPDMRLDDLMVSYATDGGGVGPHFDSYDVFLLQTHGQRRWRIGRQKDLALQEGVPLKVLADFVPDEEYLLSPGDMLYLPPRYAHEGVAVGECITCSIGFRAPKVSEVAQELLQRLSEDAADAEDARLYADPRQPATEAPAAMPEAMLAFAREALDRVLQDRDALPRALGEYMTEPKAQVWFDETEDAALHAGQGLRLDRRTRMLYDARHVFINGESYRAAGRDARLMQRLANARALTAQELRGASADAEELLADWCASGWVHAVSPEGRE